MQEVIDKFTDIMDNEYGTDEERQKAQTEVLRELADEFEQPLNAVRVALAEAGKLYKAAPKVASTTGKAPRANKQQAIDSLKVLVESVDADLWDDKMEKFTGVMALRLAEIIEKAKCTA